MKKITSLSLFAIIGCILIILVAIYFTQTNSSNEVETSISPKTTPSITATAPSGIRGLLTVSIGAYSATRLPVFIDDTNAGEVSQGKPLNINLNEGRHSVKVCSGEVCERADVEIKFGVTTTIDFGELLKKDVPQGRLNISIGDLNAQLPVLIDNISVGNVSLDMPLSLNVSEGQHTVKVCIGLICENESVEIKYPNQTSVDFGERLKRILRSGPLRVSIGGYNAQLLPVFIDNKSVGVVSQSKPLDLMVFEGTHTVKVCVGIVCENETVEIRFAQQSSVDFGERLKKDAEFPTPIMRIVNSVQTGTTIYVDVEYINPDKTDHTMSATIRCVYSYINANRDKSNEFVQVPISLIVKAGERKLQRSTLYMIGGRDVIATEPVLYDISII